MASTDACLFSILALHGLRAKVSLGVSDTERQTPQFVLFDVKLRLASLPGACLSDNLSETICYARLSEMIQEVSHQSAYHLIEHLGWKVFSALRESIPPSTKLWIRVLKEKPPIPELQNGASFSIGDWPEGGPEDRPHVHRPEDRLEDRPKERDDISC